MWRAGATFRHSSHGDLSDGLAVQLGGDAHGVVRVVLQAVEPGAKVIHSKYYKQTLLLTAAVYS